MKDEGEGRRPRFRKTPEAWITVLTYLAERQRTEWPVNIHPHSTNWTVSHGSRLKTALEYYNDQQPNNMVSALALGHMISDAMGMAPVVHKEYFPYSEYEPLTEEEYDSSYTIPEQNVGELEAGKHRADKILINTKSKLLNPLVDWQSLGVIGPQLARFKNKHNDEKVARLELGFLRKIVVLLAKVGYEAVRPTNIDGDVDDPCLIDLGRISSHSNVAEQPPDSPSSSELSFAENEDFDHTIDEPEDDQSVGNTSSLLIFPQQSSLHDEEGNRASTQTEDDNMEIVATSLPKQMLPAANTTPNNGNTKLRQPSSTSSSGRKRTRAFVDHVDNFHRMKKASSEHAQSHTNLFTDYLSWEAKLEENKEKKLQRLENQRLLVQLVRTSPEQIADIAVWERLGIEMKKREGDEEKTLIKCIAAMLDALSEEDKIDLSGSLKLGAQALFNKAFLPYDL
jgi:hypothetical protein